MNQEQIIERMARILAKLEVFNRKLEALIAELDKTAREPE